MKGKVYINFTILLSLSCGNIISDKFSIRLKKKEIKA